MNFVLLCGLFGKEIDPYLFLFFTVINTAQFMINFGYNIFSYLKYNLKCHLGIEGLLYLSGQFPPPTFAQFPANIGRRTVNGFQIPSGGVSSLRKCCVCWNRTCCMASLHCCFYSSVSGVNTLVPCLYPPGLAYLTLDVPTIVDNLLSVPYFLVIVIDKP